METNKEGAAAIATLYEQDKDYTRALMYYMEALRRYLMEIDARNKENEWKRFEPTVRKIKELYPSYFQPQMICEMYKKENPKDKYTMQEFEELIFRIQTEDFERIRDGLRQN